MKDSNSNKPFSNSKGWKILGLTKQDFIKYFFGGNAMLAILILIGIIVFLVYHATSFFPQYQKKLTLYRLSGQELVDYSSKQYNQVFELKSLTIQAREYELQKRLGALYRVTSVHSEFKGKVLKKAIAERKELKRAKTSLATATAKSEVTPEQIKQAEDYLAKVKKEFKEVITKSVNNLDYDDVNNKSWATDEKFLNDIRSSVVENIIIGEETAYIKDIKEQEAVITAEIDQLPFIQQLMKSGEDFAKPLPKFKSYIQELRDISYVNKAQGEKFGEAKATIATNEIAKELARTEEKKALKQLKIDRQLTVEPDYTKLAEPLYASKDTQKPHYEALTAAVTAGMSTIPDADKFEAKASVGFIEEIRDIESEIYASLDESRNEIVNWKHDEPYGMWKTVKGFFFGTEWITNSSWQDFYGIVPLLAGSVFVAVVAIAISVPFSVGGAIYVNRLASKGEQNFIKPFIEFIQAIPSIVLAFFGYVVLGVLIQKYSQTWMFSLLPGFPVEDQYTILNAGLLLALMAVPTIFTLCEDALNNVPSSYKEASLALGATKLQTVTKIILPSCASGVIAAILLGFGRIIGETMVVLLVLGGRIAVPGSWTEPAHSMTGILAQEIGEVNEGSLHWGALFMVGLVLFTIALGLNYVSQRVLQKYTR
ncbi:MAG: phosphate transport system permease protein [Cryomorphaceae bacterium]|jgi:phosphate transport system permease protein